MIPESVRLSRAAWPDVTQQVLLVPVGSTEQHGHHLPLSTDTLIAEALANGAAAHISGATVAPSITMSASGEHEGFPGTISIGTDVLTNVLIEIVRSACRWAEVVVFVNGHGGNTEAFRRAEQQWTFEARQASVWAPSLPPGGDWHAGWVETSVMLAVHPDLVGPQRDDGETAQSGEVMRELHRSGVHAVSPTGVLGQPSKASVAAGEDLLTQWTNSLIQHAVQRAPTSSRNRENGGNMNCECSFCFLSEKF